jgi:uncharacterized protein YqjF (DUF2071 family)
VSSFAFLGTAARQADTLAEVRHRPWPLPDAPWTQAQSREDVLFVHWRVGLDDLARVLPPGLPLDTHDGDAWLGLVAFRLTNVRLRGLPPLPSLGFRQVDIRTYVTLDDRPGIWLCSVDASSRVLAEAAKRAHRLPAYAADITTSTDTGPSAGGSYELDRGGLVFSVGFRPRGDAFAPEPGTLEHFLTERYCIYTADGGRLYRTQIHHPRWCLRHAEAAIGRNTISPVAVEQEPRALHADSQDLLVWPLEEL